MQSFLRVATAHPEATVRNNTVKTWVKQVRDLAYGIEDYLLYFALYAATTSSSRAAGSWLSPAVIVARYRIVARIRDLKASIEDINQRNLRYHVVVGSPVVAPRAADEQKHVMLPNDADHDELTFQLGIIDDGNEKAQLIELIYDNNGSVGVVSVWGMGGMVKSSLVCMVHNNPVVLKEFDYDAWIVVSHPLDNPDMFWW